MDSRSTYEEEERRRQRRKEWVLQQELEREHEKRKLRMIKAYERQRAEKLKMESESRRSKSASPHRRTSSTDKRSEESKMSSTLKSFKNINIDVKELHRIKVKIERTATDDSKPELEPNIDKSVDIVLPRRKDEGSRPLFDLVVSPKQSLTNNDSGETSGRSSNYYNYNYNYYNYNTNTNNRYNNSRYNRYNNRYNNNDTRIHGHTNTLQT
ncbi:uncharacterized protein DDB_G0287625-like [Pseudomyrmex gracilis]|uniref:uncharacterized protein DDB_G0287625-like n=1 Tax=Pseudomyrmex gracilis TaxID=219809 RepID=UPI0009954F05|nr:uncharacterized protein DDB_G0287625-like [Pseudomyrmex gracilis]XP_020281651.1 uncharacterized protein DDB_G0287625-like [Pseudomyrmex gracilis]